MILICCFAEDSENSTKMLDACPLAHTDFNSSNKTNKGGTCTYILPTSIACSTFSHSQFLFSYLQSCRLKKKYVDQYTLFHENKYNKEGQWKTEADLFKEFRQTC